MGEALGRNDGNLTGETPRIGVFLGIQTFLLVHFFFSLSCRLLWCFLGGGMSMSRLFVCVSATFSLMLEFESFCLLVPVG